MLSYHIYPQETIEIFLQRSVRPFLEQYVWNTKGARGFFIRFEDEIGEHVRLRLRGDADFMANAPNWVAEHFENRGEIKAIPFEPETDRFGGAETLAWAEEYFHQSTRVTLEQLNKETTTYGDAMFEALKLHVITAFALGFDPKKASWYFEQLHNQWLPLFFKPNPEEANNDWQADVKYSFAKGYETQKKAIITELDKLWKSMEENSLAKNHPEYLRWLRANEFILKEMGENMEKALPSLLHLTNNRLGINNQDEVYLKYVLGRVFLG
jgi:thiopeptide-type bacteriocin biosynthesis protein